MKTLNENTDSGKMQKNKVTLFSKTNESKNSLFFFQPKLSINQPNDRYEQEADAVAERVMRMSMPVNEQPFFSPKPVSVSGLQRKCAECEEEEKLQRKEDGNGEMETHDEVVHYEPESTIKVVMPSKHNASFFKSKISSETTQIIQRIASYESPYMENAEIGEEEEETVQRKAGIPDIQRMERVTSTDPSRVTARNVHPWLGQPPVGDNINVDTDNGSTIGAWVAYGGPDADRYWCHGHTLGTYAASLYSVYSGDPIMQAVNDEYRSVSDASVQSGDIAVWVTNYGHSCIFQNVVRSGSFLDPTQTTMSTKNGRNPLQILSLDQVNGIYGTSTNQPAFFRHV